MIKKIENKPQGPVEIDLTGPDGNVYSLIKQARKFANDAGLDADKIQKDMSNLAPITDGNNKTNQILNHNWMDDPSVHTSTRCQHTGYCWAMLPASPAPSSSE